MVRVWLNFGISSVAAFALLAPFSSAQTNPNRVTYAPSFNGSCSECSLSGRNMVGWNLTRASYSNASFTGSSLRSVIAHSTDFSGIKASRADFRDADLTGAKFGQADLSNSRLDAANILGGDFTGASMMSVLARQTVFVGCTLTDAQMQAAHAIGADFSAANLERTNLSGANLVRGVFDNAVLNETVLTGANLTDASFRSARFENVNLTTVLGMETANLDGACATSNSIIPVGLKIDPCDEPERSLIDEDTATNVADARTNPVRQLP